MTDRLQMINIGAKNLGFKSAIICSTIFLISILPELIIDHTLVLGRDFLQQQIPFILETKRMLASGFPFWSWNTFLGDNFWGAYAFYTLGSPFVWIATLFPENYIVYGIIISFLIRCGFSAYFSFSYLKIFLHNKKYAVIGSILYTFSSYMLINLTFNHFLEIMVVFPFLLAELEKRLFLKNGRNGILALAFFVNAFVNFYFFVSTCLFVLIYAIFRFLSGDWKCNIRIYLSVFIEMVLGISLAAIIIIPFLMKMIDTPRAGIYLQLYIFPFIIFERIRTIFMPIHIGIMNPFYPFVFWWNSTAAFLPVIGGCFTLAYVYKMKDWLKYIIIFCFTISLIPPLNALFSGLSSYSYTRWWYAFVLLMTLASCKVLDQNIMSICFLRRIWLIIIVGILLLTVPFMLLIYCNDMLPDNFIVNYFKNMNIDIEGSNALLYSVLLTIINLSACYFVIQKEENFLLILWIFVCVTILNLGSYLFFTIKYDMHKEQMWYDNVLNKDYINDSTFFYRVDHNHAMTNLGLYINKPTLSTFHSVRHKSSADFIDAIGIMGKGNALMNKPVGQFQESLDALLSVKYFVAFLSDSIHPVGYKFLKKMPDGANLMMNENFIPMGFTYDSYILKQDLNKLLEKRDTCDRYNVSSIMLGALIIDKEDEKKILSYLHKADISDLSKKTFTNFVADRRQNSCDEFIPSSEGFSASISLNKDNFVFFSVPYDRGFKAFVNGVESEIIRTNIGFMSILGKKGSNKIQFIYKPVGFNVGCYISLTSLVFLFIYLLIQRKYEIKHSSSML